MITIKVSGGADFTFYGATAQNVLQFLLDSGYTEEEINDSNLSIVVQDKTTIRAEDRKRKERK